MPKTLLVFCDGTGMDGTLSEPNSTLNQDDPSILASNRPNEGLQPGNIPGEGGGDSKQYSTNVVRLSRSVKNKTSSGKEQIVFYQSGVGSEANFKGDPVTGTTALQALGTAVASKIRDAYNFVAQNYEDGDEICLFGFSRGAYTARKLSGLIDRIGLLRREKLGLFFEIWRQLMDGVTPTIPLGTRHPRIKVVGVWDTVGSVYDTINALNIKDTSLPATVDVALHALSLQENRKKFLPTLWTLPKGGLGPRQVLKQYWFPGAHSDVGGGYERHELADISLFWMAGEVKDLIELDLEFLRAYEQPNPDPWGTSQPHNAYEELPAWKQLIIGHETRLESGQIEKTSRFHESNKFAPQNLKEPKYMVTMSIIGKQFGSGFRPDFAPMNQFEKYCKERWGKRKVALPPPVSDDPAIIILPPLPSLPPLPPLPPISWKPGVLGVLPPDAVKGGFESDGELLYVARAPYKNGLHPGKASKSFVYISYGGKEIPIRDDFELLVGTAIRWVPVQGVFSLSKLGGSKPVRGGYEADKETLYVARAIRPDGQSEQCGKVKENSHAYIPYGGEEVIATDYSVLVLA